MNIIQHVICKRDAEHINWLKKYAYLWTIPYIVAWHKKIHLTEYRKENCIVIENLLAGDE